MPLAVTHSCVYPQQEDGGAILAVKNEVVLQTHQSSIVETRVVPCNLFLLLNISALTGAGDVEWTNFSASVDTAGGSMFAAGWEHPVHQPLP